VLRASADVALGAALEEARSLGAAPPGGREPFAIVMRGPAEPVLAQGIVGLEHPALGACDVFFVPVGRDERGTAYEAVFS
jgi:hypothetical protein